MELLQHYLSVNQPGGVMCQTRGEESLCVQANVNKLTEND